MILSVENFWKENKTKQTRQFKIGDTKYAFRAKPTVFTRQQRGISIKEELLELELIRLSTSKIKGQRIIRLLRYSQELDLDDF